MRPQVAEGNAYLLQPTWPTRAFVPSSVACSQEVPQQRLLSASSCRLVHATQFITFPDGCEPIFDLL
eukprot:766480-Hanusia_phi.AAC.4